MLGFLDLIDFLSNATRQSSQEPLDFIPTACNWLLKGPAHTSKCCESCWEPHLCLRIQNDIMDHWHEIRESVLWVRELQWHWKRHTYCRICLVCYNWFSPVSLVLGASLYDKSCTVKSRFKHLHCRSRGRGVSFGRVFSDCPTGYTGNDTRTVVCWMCCNNAGRFRHKVSLSVRQSVSV